MYYTHYFAILEYEKNTKDKHTAYTTQVHGHSHLLLSHTQNWAVPLINTHGIKYTIYYIEAFTIVSECPKIPQCIVKSSQQPNNVLSPSKYIISGIMVSGKTLNKKYSTTWTF